MFYLCHTPWWLRAIFPPQVHWKAPAGNGIIYLSFDDGPTPGVTPWVLQQLEQYGFKATFFCIGQEVEAHPHIVQQTMQAGHKIANHTYTHPNGWKTSTAQYLQEIEQTYQRIPTTLFRPPYGRITRKQREALRLQRPNMEVVMWSVVPGDFDERINGELCFERVKKYAKPGGIIVFHDSQKAYARLQVALPLTLQWMQQQGFTSEVLPW